MKNLFLFILLAVSLTGCDSVYRYVFLPPERFEYTLVPDKQVMEEMQDTSYYITKDGQAIGYNAKDWKIEVRYMSDYQLNTFEFPDESKNGELSGNPFTYGNWIDPSTNYTPKRFTVFKVTIYNYSGSKLNYDPEASIVQTDRGDFFHAYAREQKNAKYQSIEEYYKIRKGASGVDEDIFETRMGIARRTMLYYGKPIYKGDTRDGLVVFDPIVPSVEELKFNIKNFVLEYDENNEPSKLKDIVFYFKQVPLDAKTVQKQSAIAKTNDSTDNNGKKSFEIAQLKYNVTNTRTNYVEPWNPIPGSIKSLVEYTEKNTSLVPKLLQISIDDKELKNAKLAFIIGGGATPALGSNYVSSVADYLQNGGFLYVDNSYLSNEWPYNKIMSEFMEEVKSQLKGSTEIKRINLDHPIFKAYKNITAIPKGWDDLNSDIEATDHIDGLFLDGKLVAVLSSKGYPAMWSKEQKGGNYDIQNQLEFGANIISYAFKNEK